MDGEDRAAKIGSKSATAALAAAVAKRAEARKVSSPDKRKALHGGKPLANIKMTAQIKGK